jgi:hypothetical protein
MEHFANQAYWESQGHIFHVEPDTEEQAAAKQAERDAVKARNSESVRAMFKAGNTPANLPGHEKPGHWFDTNTNGFNDGDQT